MPRRFRVSRRIIIFDVVFLYLVVARYFRAASLVAAAVPVSRAVRRIGVVEAEGTSDVGRRVLTHRHVLSRPGGDPRTRRTPPGAGFRDQARRPTVVHALRHEADRPYVTAQLVHLPIRTEGLHLAAVHAKVHVADTTDLAVVSSVGMYHLDEIGVTGV